MADHVRARILNVSANEINPATEEKQPIDLVSGARIAIDEAHYEIHIGKSYTVTANVSIAATENFDCQITAPDTAVRIHMVMHCRTSANGITVTVYEAPTTSGGTAVPIYNRDRNSSNTATAAFVHTPTVTSTGTTIINVFHIAAGVAGSGAESREESEFILKQNTKYLIRITADSGAAANFSGRMDWYEEE